MDIKPRPSGQGGGASFYRFYGYGVSAGEAGGTAEYRCFIPAQGHLLSIIPVGPSGRIAGAQTLSTLPWLPLALFGLYLALRPKLLRRKEAGSHLSGRP